MMVGGTWCLNWLVRPCRSDGGGVGRACVLNGRKCASGLPQDDNASQHQHWQCGVWRIKALYATPVCDAWLHAACCCCRALDWVAAVLSWLASELTMPGAGSSSSSSASSSRCQLGQAELTQFIDSVRGLCGWGGECRRRLCLMRMAAVCMRGGSDMCIVGLFWVLHLNMSSMHTTFMHCSSYRCAVAT
jgi:hypothetical protein